MRILVSGRGRVATITCACLLALAAVGCGKAQISGYRDTPRAGSSGAASDAGGAGSLGIAGIVEAAGNGGSPSEPPGTRLPSELRRLTANEYVASVLDVLGIDASGTALAPLTASAASADGFDNNADANVAVSTDSYQRYLEIAEGVAAQAFADSALRARIVSCTQADDATCVRQIVSQAGLRLFRRPLLADELSAYQAEYTRARTRGLSHEDAAKELLTALLASAQFVYRMELLPSDGSATLSPYDIAARLSYLLWSSAPDDALLQAAANNQLASEADLQGALARLLLDDKSRRFSQNFGAQWLGARGIRAQAVDPSSFPQWSVAVATAATEEVQAYFDDFFRNERPLPDLFASRAHFVNQDLAPLYGVQVTGTALQRVDGTQPDRQGFLGLVGFLVLDSRGARTSPSFRGARVLRDLLCTPLPELPMDHPQFQNAGATLHDYLNGIDSRAPCSSCHAQMDALGLPLEGFNAIGQTRAFYGVGSAVDGSAVDLRATLPSIVAPSPAGPIASAAELSVALGGSDAFRRCVAQKLYGYGFGHSYSANDATNVDLLASSTLDDPLTMKQLLLRLVTSAEFRGRSAGDKP